MKHVNGLLLNFLLVITLISCKKDKPEHAQFRYTFSPRSLEYVKLSEGKYLIYKDSATSQLDSVIVTKCTLETLFSRGYEQNGQKMPAYDYELFTLELSKFDGSIKTTWLSASANTQINRVPDSYNNIDTFPMLLHRPNNALAFYFYESLQSNFSITIEGKLYNNVIVYISDDFNGDISNPYYEKTTYYWAKGVGIIKRENITTGGAIKTYTLLRNN